MNKTPWKKIVSDHDFLGEADFNEGEEKIATIDRVKSGVEVKTAKGTERKSVVYFMERIKPMILNVARSKAITKVSGSKFVEDWHGVQIALYIDDNVSAFGEIVSAVRVRDRKPIARTAVKCADCGGDIRGAYGKGADYIAVYTKRQYGVSLCSECAEKRKALTMPPEQEAPQQEEMEGVNNDTEN